MKLDLLLLQRRIDDLLSPWRRPDGPGATVGLVLGGELALHRHAGAASIELGVPIGPDTTFRIASVSKQFTCAAVLMLEREGRLSLEDDARDHLPEIGGIGSRVTVADLMHNTSGIRDVLELMRQGGADLGTPVELPQLLEALRRQRRLNFEPGTRFLYSNSNFLLLGVLAERVAGTPLPQLLRDRIFAPLGMTRTAMTPDTRTVVPGLATGYLAKNRKWRRARHAFALHGEGGLVSGVEDLALWDRNLATRRVGGEWLDELVRQRPFPAGPVNRYARGLAVRDHRGVRTISHGGLWPGFRTEFLRVPEIGATAVVIGNAGSLDPSRLAHAVLDAILDGRAGTPHAPPLPPRAALDAMAGRFVEPETGATLDLGRDERDEFVVTAYGLPAAQEGTADGRIAAARAQAVLRIAPAGPDAIEVEREDGGRSVWERAPAGPALPAGLPGRYRSDETAATWTVAEGGDGLVVRAAGPVVADGPAWRVEPVAPDLVRIHVPNGLAQTWLDVRVRRGRDGGADALLVSGGRARNLVYERLPD